MQHFQLSDLTTRIKRSIAINFPEAVWVEAEIAQANENRGHWYLEFIQKDETSESIQSQISGVIWKSNAARISKQTDADLESILIPGQKILFEADVDYHEIYGLKLILRNLDSTFSEGILAKQRAAAIAELVETGLWDKNREKELPLVIQKVAVISNVNAAGYNDFIHQLRENAYGYHIAHELYSAAVQGANALKEIPKQMEIISQAAERYDATVIIRGGGSKMDLSVFDDITVAKSIAEHPIPVITGIGHETDETVSDMVAGRSIKTPTGAAAFLIERFLVFESKMESHLQSIHKRLQYQLGELEQKLLKNGERINSIARNQISTAGEKLSEKWAVVKSHLSWQISTEIKRTDHLENLLEQLDPTKLLENGYSILTHEGRWIKAPQEFNDDAELVNRMRGGSITSRFKSYEQSKEK